MTRFLTISALCGLLLTGVQAQADGQRCTVDSSGKVESANSSQFNDIFCGLVNRVVQARKKNDETVLTDRLKEEFDPPAGGNTGLFITALLINHQNTSPDIIKLKGSFLSLVEESRVDKQVGAGTSSSGSTSLTSKGNVPEILGFAVENGALTPSQSGTTITFAANPVGIIKALGDKGYLEGYADDDPLTRRIRDFSFSISFDASRGNSQGTFTGDAQQVSSYSFRYAFLNRRDPRNLIYNDKWRALAEGSGRKATNAENVIFGELVTNHTFQRWLDLTKSKVSDAVKGGTDQEVATSVEQALSDQLFIELVKIQDQLTDEVPTLLPLLTTYSRSQAQFLTDRQVILDLASKGSIVTFEYVNNRQLKTPDVSNFKLIAEGNAGNKVDLTTNLSFAIFNQIPLVEPNANRLHEIQFSGELDVRAGNVAHIGSIVLGLSGMYERLLNNTITSAGLVVPNTKGDLAVGQFKITIPVKGSGVKIPISLSVANRTDLIKETDVRGNVGVTLDLDSLFAKSNP